METIKSDVSVDAKGLACPMPIVKTKKAMTNLEGGQVLEILATDQGSRADLKAWADSMGHQYLGTVEVDKVLKHYIRKSTGEEAAPRQHTQVMSNAELETILSNQPNAVVLDVREAAEYAFNHIPNAISIPLGDLEKRIGELNREQDIYVVCRTGNRSDFAAQQLTKQGFTKVTNVVPGMSEWTGNTTSL